MNIIDDIQDINAYVNCNEFSFPINKIHEKEVKKCASYQTTTTLYAFVKN